MVYIPQYWTDINTVEAGGKGGGACTLPTGEPCSGLFTQIGILSTNVSSAGSNALTSIATQYNMLKDSTFDSLAWTLAKSILSQMTTDIVNWINRGFEGKPAFVQDLDRFLLNAGDLAAGKYLEELGGAFSFICDPFKIDVRLALELNYNKQVAGEPASSCTLSGALANIEDFTEGDFSKGGWENWFDISARPEVLTPYGEYLTGKAEMDARIVNAKGREVKLLDFGGGFLSAKICNATTGNNPSAYQVNCEISTPGKVIQEALTFQTSTGPRSLIEADEINEIIGALFQQLAIKAVTGAKGLLGLTPGTSQPTYEGYQTSEPNVKYANNNVEAIKLRKFITESISTEKKYRDIATNYKLLLLDKSSTSNTSTATTTATNNTGGSLSVTSQTSNAISNEIAKHNITKINILLDEIDSNLERLDSTYNKLKSTPSSEASAISLLVSDYSSIKKHSQDEIVASVTNWETVLYQGEPLINNDRNVLPNIEKIINDEITIIGNYLIKAEQNKTLLKNKQDNFDLSTTDPSIIKVFENTLTEINTLKIRLNNANTRLLELKNNVQDLKDLTYPNYGVGIEYKYLSRIMSEYVYIRIYYQNEVTDSQSEWTDILNLVP